jgi:hypothetical protein
MHGGVLGRLEILRQLIAKATLDLQAADEIEHLQVGVPEACTHVG